jgi:hypothetical protein
MKKRCIIISGIIAVLFVMSSCNTVQMSTNLVGWSDYAGIVVKDYEVVGIVTLDTTETFVYGPLGLSNTHTGSKITYADLMSEAQKLGAHDIINVRIDRYDDSNTNLLSKLSGYTEYIKYSATALAIKYTTSSADLKDVAKSDGVLKALK